MKNTPIRIELPTIFGMKTVNCYLFKEPEPILIDCGEDSPENWEALTQGVEANGLKLSDIKKVYVSHLHIDHFGAAGRLAEEFGTEIWLNEMSEGVAQHFEENHQRHKKLVYRYVFKYASFNPDKLENPFIKLEKKDNDNNSVASLWHTMPEELCKVYKTNEQLNFGNEMWDVVHMPGHASSQVVYFQKETKKLLSTDMLLAVTPTPFFEIDRDVKGKEDIRIKGLPIMMDSYKKLLELDFTVAYPGHYDVIENPKEIVEKQVAHIHKRKEACYEYIKGGTNNFLKLYEQMFSRFTIAAVTMLVGYVDLLEYEGKVKWVEGDFTIKIETT